MLGVEVARESGRIAYELVAGLHPFVSPKGIANGHA